MMHRDVYLSRLGLIGLAVFSGCVCLAVRERELVLALLFELLVCGCVSLAWQEDIPAVPLVPPVPPVLRGAHIREAAHHDAGANAQCSYCGRYTDDPFALLTNPWCQCGRRGGWTGSFKRPTGASAWSNHYGEAGATDCADGEMGRG